MISENQSKISSRALANGTLYIRRGPRVCLRGLDPELAIKAPNGASKSQISSVEVRCVSLFQPQPCTSWPLRGKVGPEHCSAFRQHMFSVRVFRQVFRSERRLNAPGEHFFVSRKRGRRQRRRPLFLICDDVLDRSVQTAFRSEHWPERLNTEQVLSER